MKPKQMDAIVMADGGSSFKDKQELPTLGKILSRIRCFNGRETFKKMNNSNYMVDQNVTLRETNVSILPLQRATSLSSLVAKF